MKEHKNVSKILALALTVILLVGIMPVGTLSAHGTKHAGASSTVSSVEVGKTVYFGQYPQSLIGSTKPHKTPSEVGHDGKYYAIEPIAWRILKVEDGSLLLISEKIIGLKTFHANGQYGTDGRLGATWNNSRIRSWLNGYDASKNSLSENYTESGFMDMAFLPAEQNAILTTTLENYTKVNDFTKGGSPSNDKIFLLSVAEAKELFVNDAGRVAVNTAWVAADSAWHHVAGGADLWWLRSVCDNNSNNPNGTSAVHVQGTGALNLSGIEVNSRHPGVRPALKLDLSMVEIDKNGKVTLKEKNKSSDATLRTLGVSIGKLSPSFERNTTSYTVTVPNNVNNIIITAVANNTKATVTGTGMKSLADGANSFNVVVTAENGAKQTYSITVTRGTSSLSSDATLKSLTVNTGTLSPAFARNTTSYSVSVPNSVSSINISAEANDAKATVAGTGTKSLAVGANSFNIVVTAENGAKQTYSITVTRGTSSLSSDATLKSLTVNTGTLSPAFARNTTSYTLSVPSSVSSINITAEAYDAKATITGTGTKSLAAGTNIFSIIVTAENGAKQTYNITVTRSSETQAAPKLSNADFLQAKSASILRNGLSQSDLVLDGKVLTLIIDDREFVLSTNANNRNINGEISLGNGYYLKFDIKGNGSNVKDFKVCKK